MLVDVHDKPADFVACGRLQSSKESGLGLQSLGAGRFLRRQVIKLEGILVGIEISEETATAGMALDPGILQGEYRVSLPAGFFCFDFDIALFEQFPVGSR